MKKIGKKSLSILLAMCMVLSLFLKGQASASAVGVVSVSGSFLVNAEADLATAVPSEFGLSASEGRVWTDKSVAVNADYGFDVTLSALAQEYISTATSFTSGGSTKADVVFVLDLSGSMGWTGTSNGLDVSIAKAGGGTETIFRYDAMVRAVNEAISIILKANPDNRIAVYGFGNEVVEILPLCSYEFMTDDIYLTAYGTNLKSGLSQYKNQGVQIAAGVKKTGHQTALPTSKFALQSGTNTQLGVYTSVKGAIDAVTSSSNTVGYSVYGKRQPFIFLLSDGAAYKESANWWNSPPDGTDTGGTASSGSQQSAAATILTSVLMKDKMTEVYRTYNGNSGSADVETTTNFYTVGMGSAIYSASSASNYAWCGLDPASMVSPGSLPGNATGNAASASATLTQIAAYVDAAGASYNNYKNAANYVYNSYYKYADNYSVLSEAFAKLSGDVSTVTQTVTLPVTTSRSRSALDSVAITMTDTLGSGMTLSSAPKLYDTTGTPGSDGRTYRFTGHSSTAEVNDSTITWRISAEDMASAMYKFKDPNDTSKGYTSVPPITLTYGVRLAPSVTPAEVMAGSSFYSNDACQAVFSPTSDNPYFFYVSEYAGLVSRLVNLGNPSDLNRCVKGTVIGTAIAGATYSDVYISGDMVAASGGALAACDVGTIAASITAGDNAAFLAALGASLKNCATAESDDGTATFAFCSGTALTGDDSKLVPVLKSGIPVDSNPYVSSPTQSDGRVTIELGNNGKLTPVAGLSKNATGAMPAGGTVNYTVKVYNYGGSAVTNVVVTDAIPSGMTHVTNTTDPSDAAYTNAGTPTWTLFSIAPDSSAMLTFTAKLPAAAPIGTRYSNTAAITSADGLTISGTVMPTSAPAVTTVATGYNISTAYATGGSGTQGTTSGGGTGLAAGSQVTITAVPQQGYRFVGWYTDAGCSGAPASSSADYTFEVQSGGTYYAKFEQLSYTVSATTGTGGTVGIAVNGTAAPGSSATVNYGDEVVMTATAQGGYAFNGFTLNSGTAGNSKNNVYTIASLTANTSVNASFVLQGTLTFDSNGGTSFPAKPVNEGDKIADHLPSEAPARQGYDFDGWFDADGSAYERDGTAHTPMPGTGFTLIAHWTPNYSTYPFWVIDNDGNEFGYDTLTNAVVAINTGLFTNHIVFQRADAAVVGDETLPDGYKLLSDHSNENLSGVPSGGFSLTLDTGNDSLHIGCLTSNNTNNDKDKSWHTGATVEGVNIMVEEGDIYIDGQRSTVDRAISLWPEHIVNFVSDVNTGNYFNITLLNNSGVEADALNIAQGWESGDTVCQPGATDGDHSTEDGGSTGPEDYNLYGGRVKVTNPGITQYTDYGNWPTLPLKLMAEERVMAVRLPYNDQTKSYADVQFVFDYGTLAGAAHDMAVYSDGSNDNRIYIVSDITEDITFTGDTDGTNAGFTLISGTRVVKGDYGTVIRVDLDGGVTRTLSGNITLAKTQSGATSVWFLDNIRVTGDVTLRKGDETAGHDGASCYLEATGQWPADETITLTAANPAAQLGDMLVKNCDDASRFVLTNSGYYLAPKNGNLYLARNTATVTVTVENTDPGVSTIHEGEIYVLTLKDGNNEIQETTYMATKEDEAAGNFSLSFANVADGDYTVTAAWGGEGDLQLVTERLVMKDGKHDPVTLYVSQYIKNTELSLLTPTSDRVTTPHLTVRGLNGIYDFFESTPVDSAQDGLTAVDSANITQPDAASTIQLRAIGVDGDAPGNGLDPGNPDNLADDVAMIHAAASNQDVALFIDLSLWKNIQNAVVDPQNFTQINSSGRLLTISVPLTGMNGKDFRAYRVHEGVATEIPQLSDGDPNGTTEYCEPISADRAILHVNLFSLYAFTFTPTNNNTSQNPSVPEQKPALNKTEHFAYTVGYPDGSVRPHALMSREEVATIFFRLLSDTSRKAFESSDNPFKDVAADRWSNRAISTLYRAGIITGKSATSFDPSAHITRAELATIAARFDDLKSGTTGYSDIAGHWAESYIAGAAANGWVTGYPDGTFKPDANITRAEAMTLINRVLGRLPEAAEDLLTGMNTWPDNADPEVWYYLAIQEATSSHDCTLKFDKTYERWIALKENPNWAALER